MKFAAVSLAIVFSFSTAAAFTLNGFDGGWRGSTLKVNVNPANCPAGTLSRLDEAFSLWNSVAASDLKLEMGSTGSSTTPAQVQAKTASDAPVVVCDPNFGTTTGADPDSVLGAAYTRNDGSYIVNGGLILNAESGRSGHIGQQNSTRQAVIIAHELGHVLGLGHSQIAPALMYYDIGSKENLTLAQDDWDGMAYLYPRDELGNLGGIAGCGLTAALRGGAPGGGARFPIGDGSGSPAGGAWTWWLLSMMPLAAYVLSRRDQRARSNVRAK